MPRRDAEPMNDRETPHSTCAGRPPGAWDVLDRLVRELPACPTAGGQIRLVLEAVRTATRADVVYWYPGSTGQPMQLLGTAP
jgi:hypothetical protein